MYLYSNWRCIFWTLEFISTCHLRIRWKLQQKLLKIKKRNQKKYRKKRQGMHMFANTRRKSGKSHSPPHRHIVGREFMKILQYCMQYRWALFALTLALVLALSPSWTKRNTHRIIVKLKLHRNWFVIIIQIVIAIEIVFIAFLFVFIVKSIWNERKKKQHQQNPGSI